MVAFLDTFDTDDRPMRLEYHLERIALESNYIATVITSLKNSLPDFISNISDNTESLLSRFVNIKDITHELTKKQSKVLNAVKHYDYLVFGDIYVSVPDGFLGNYLEYSEFLNSIVSRVFNIDKTLLREYCIMLSTFISNMDEKISLVDHTTFYKKVRREREEITNDSKKFFNKSEGSTKAKLRTVISRFSELEDLMHSVSSLTSSVTSSVLQNIHHSTTDCVNLLNFIILSINKGQTKNISPAVANNIAVGAYEVGKYVELAGIIYYDITVFLHSIDKLYDKLLAPNKT